MGRHAVTLLAVVLATLGGCTPPPAPVAAPTPPTQAELQAAYDAAIGRGAVTTQARALAHPLLQIDPRAARTRVVSWMSVDTANRFYDKPDVRVGRDAWVTVEPQLRELCKDYPTGHDALRLRLQQALGLPPVNEERIFVVMDVDTRALIRPCPNPDPSTLSCGTVFPAAATQDYKAWFAEQVVGRYMLPGGYPWTRLGFTYDWAPDGETTSISEFVIRTGGTVRVLDRVATEAYCRPARR